MVFKCKMCGGDLEVSQNLSVGTCQYCGSTMTIPRLDERRINLYDRANYFRQNDEFDKAMSLYEIILYEDRTDAEAYWSIVLCKYGVAYVEDPKTHTMIPTCNRTQFTSIFADGDYKKALEYADRSQKCVYEQEAQVIDTIQKSILRISKSEAPFDVFICCKVTDKTGKRTPDSVLAQDLYQELTKEGFHVFFSKITLEGKLGTAYEPYIFAALNSSRVMVVIGTKPEYFSAPWVKNEWNRYLTLIRNGDKKTLIPAYRDMNPYDLPEEFAHLQAQDMSKIGFLQDLVWGIKKLTSNAEASPAQIPIIINSHTTGNAESLLRRTFLFLEDGEWATAKKYCERVLDLQPENAVAYVARIMAKRNVRNMEGLANCKKRFDGDPNFVKAYKFANAELRKKLDDYNRSVIDRLRVAENEEMYEIANRKTTGTPTEEEFLAAAKMFKSLGDYRDAQARAQDCRISAKNAGEKAREKAREIAILEQEKRISDEKLNEKLKKIILVFIFLIILKLAYSVVAFPREQAAEAREISQFLEKKELEGRTILSTSARHIVGVKKDGTVLAAGKNDRGECNVSLWENIISVETAMSLTVGLKEDGTVVAAGSNNHGQCNVEEWTDIIAVTCGWYHTVGLKKDGTVVTVGSNEAGQCDVSEWTDIVAIQASIYGTIGLKSDGTLVTAGIGEGGSFEVLDWKDVIAISTHITCTLGLTADGVVLAAGSDPWGEEATWDFSNWQGITAVAAGSSPIGLKSDGSVTYTGKRKVASAVEDWGNVVFIACADDCVAAVKRDGRVRVKGSLLSQYDVRDWKLW